MISVEIRDMENILKQLPNEKLVKKALSRAYNRAAGPINTIAAKMTADKYHVTKEQVRRIADIKKATAANPELTITWKAKKLGLEWFDTTTPITPGRDAKGHGLPVYSKAKRSSGTTHYKGAFVGSVKGNLFVFRRSSNKRLPIKRILGPSPAQLMRNEEFQEKTRMRAYMILEKRVPAEVMYLMSKMK